MFSIHSNGNFWVFCNSEFINLREINFGRNKASQTAILTISVALNYEFLRIFDIFMYEIPKT